jgi:hypothetical protein
MTNAAPRRVAAGSLPTESDASNRAVATVGSALTLDMGAGAFDVFSTASVRTAAFRTIEFSNVDLDTACSTAAFSTADLDAAFSIGDLDAAWHRLGAAATSPPRANPEGFRELVAIDPDGNKIRLFSWAPGHHT